MTEQHSGHHAVLCVTWRQAWVCELPFAQHVPPSSHGRLVTTEPSPSWIQDFPLHYPASDHHWSDQRRDQSVPSLGNQKPGERNRPAPLQELAWLFLATRFAVWTGEFCTLTKGEEWSRPMKRNWRQSTWRVLTPAARGPSCVLRVLWGRRPSILTTNTLSSFSESEWPTVCNHTGTNIPRLHGHHEDMVTRSLSVQARLNELLCHKGHKARPSGRPLHEYLHCDRSSSSHPKLKGKAGRRSD